MKTLVLSLGGSLIIPEEIDFKFLDSLKKELRKHYKTHKFVIVCGGGSVARKYISALGHEHASTKELATVGIRSTRMNALFLMQLFGKEANDVLPLDMKHVSNDLKKNNVVICGALRFTQNSTSDGTAARLAEYLNTEFINMTNIKGLFSSNPVKNKNAKFIPWITWRDFERMSLKIKFKAGQHFVLDQEAAVIIRKNKIPTYIIGKSAKNLSKIIKNKKFIGTRISE